MYSLTNRDDTNYIDQTILNNVWNKIFLKDCTGFTIIQIVCTLDIYWVIVIPSVNIAPQFPLDWLILVKKLYEWKRKEQVQMKHESVKKMEKSPRTKNNLEYMAIISEQL